MADAPILSGDLGLISLFDLGQLLMLNGATGELIVTRDAAKGYLYFERGQIVNAVDDQYHEGEGAAYRLFSWKKGAYEFRPGSPGGQRGISESTEGLMMEAARRMDEQGGGDTGGEAEKLARRAGSLESLRDAFLSVASETRGGGAGGSAGSPFALLRDPSDALLLRPGRAPRLLQSGRWRDTGAPVLDAAAYEQVRSRLLEDPHDAVAAPGGGRTRVLTHEDGARLVVTRLESPHEGLWIRAASLAPPGPAQLNGPIGELELLLTSRSGLLVIGGPDAECADRLFHACVAHLARRRGPTALLLADHGRWAHADEAGALLRASPEALTELLRAVSPDAAAFDTAHAAASVEALSTAPMVLVAVVAPDAAALLPRWCARVGRQWGDGIESVLAGAPVGLVYTPRTPENGRIPFDVSHVGDVTAVEAPPAPPPGEPIAPAAAPTSPEHPPESAAPASAPRDPMAALAAELKRTLRKAA